MATSTTTYLFQKPASGDLFITRILVDMGDNLDDLDDLLDGTTPLKLNAASTGYEWDDNAAAALMTLGRTSGQLALPKTGSGGGLLIGADVQLYRGAANRLDLASGDGLYIVSGGMWITGDAGTPPANTANAGGVLTLAAGSNAGVNDTLVGLDAFRSATRIGRWQWGLAGVAIAGITTAVNDLVWVNSAGGYRAFFDDSTNGLVALGEIRSGGNLALLASTAYAGTLTHAISAARTWTLPNAAGTIALQTAVNFGPAAVASITVVNGIITAIS